MRYRIQKAGKILVIEDSGQEHEIIEESGVLRCTCSTSKYQPSKRRLCRHLIDFTQALQRNQRQ